MHPFLKGPFDCIIFIVLLDVASLKMIQRQMPSSPINKGFQRIAALEALKFFSRFSDLSSWRLGRG